MANDSKNSNAIANDSKGIANHSKNSKRAANGAGSIYKHTITSNGKSYTYWESAVTVGYDPGTGNQKRKLYRGKTQKEVREQMQAAAVAVNDGTYFEPSKMTVAAWLDIWLDVYCANLKPKSIEKYNSDFKNHIMPALGAVKLAKLTTAQIQGFYNELARSGKKTKVTDSKGREFVVYEPLAPKTIRAIHGALSKALNTAVRLGYIKSNPAALCTTPKITKKEIHPLTDEQIQAFLKACEREQYGNVYKLILFTGLREGEALGLTWDCVNFKTGELKIYQQLQRQNGENKFVPLKNSKPRYLTPAPFIMQLLKQQQDKQTEERFQAAEFWQGWQSLAEREKALVFTKPDGSPITAAALYQRYKHIAASIGVPDSRVHDLRHTYAVISLQNGDNVKTVQENLGHATAAFTLDVYGHVSDKMKNDSAARMQAYICSLA